MGACVSKNSLVSYACEEDPNISIQKLMILQEKISGILKQREEDNEAFEREMMMFALKEAEWRKEKKKMKDEMKRLRRTLEEKEEKIRKMMMVHEKGESESSVSVSVSVSGGSFSGSSGGGSMMLVEQMREERARRDETIEKWKMLYLAIKNELDDLIRRTHQGALYWREEDQEEEEEEESVVEELQQELKVKDETIEFLKAQIASMKNEENKRKREVDILRQSLKILSSKKGSLHQHLLSTPL